MSRCWLDWTGLLTSIIWIGSVSFRPSRRKEVQVCRLMRARQTVRLGSLQRGEAFLTSAPSHCSAGGRPDTVPLWPSRKWTETPGQLRRSSLKGLWTSLLNRRVWGDFLWPVHCLEVTISSKVFWHATPGWSHILHLFLLGALSMGGSACFML